MLRSAPPPYAGELCKNAGNGKEHDLDITRRGTYHGLCSFCRRAEADRRRERRQNGLLPKSIDTADPPPRRGIRDLDGMRDEMEARGRQRPRLKHAIAGLAAAGERLQEALDDRDAANVHAVVAVAEFKEALQVVGRCAQSLLNTSPSRNGNSH